MTCKLSKEISSYIKTSLDNGCGGPCSFSKISSTINCLYVQFIYNNPQVENLWKHARGTSDSQCPARRRCQKVGASVPPVLGRHTQPAIPGRQWKGMEEVMGWMRVNKVRSKSLTRWRHCWWDQFLFWEVGPH